MLGMLGHVWLGSAGHLAGLRGGDLATQLHMGARLLGWIAGAIGATMVLVEIPRARIALVACVVLLAGAPLLRHGGAVAWPTLIAGAGGLALGATLAGQRQLALVAAGGLALGALLQPPPLPSVILALLAVWGQAEPFAMVYAAIEVFAPGLDAWRATPVPVLIGRLRWPLALALAVACTDRK